MMYRLADYKDFTLKATLASSMEMEKTLHKLGAKYLGADRQTDTYFNTPKGKLKLRQGTIENLITHYERIVENRVERTKVYRYDLNPSKAEIAKIHNDHEVIGIIEKERKIYFLDHIKIHLDSMKDGKTFIEIEAIDRNGSIPSDELRQQCMDVKEKLQIGDRDLIKTGYLEM
jgi:adenylate cyclase, class 2